MRRQGGGGGSGARRGADARRLSRRPRLLLLASALFLLLQTAASRRSRAGDQLLAAVAAAGGAAAPTCMGLVPEMCKPCPNGGPDEFCTDIKTECTELFCSPLCRRNTWKCSIDFGSFSPEAGDASYEGALCAQFIAEGCANDLQCCAEDWKLWDYIENHAYYDQYPNPRMPTPSCLEGPTPALCGKCKGAVKVTLEELECPYPQPEGEMDPKQQTFSMARDFAGNPFPGPNAHKGIQERVGRAALAFGSAISSLDQPTRACARSASSCWKRSRPSCRR
jgi:hypothetical protein